MIPSVRVRFIHAVHALSHEVHAPEWARVAAFQVCREAGISFEDVRDTLRTFNPFPPAPGGVETKPPTHGSIASPSA